MVLPIADSPRISKPVTIAAVNKQISPRELNRWKRRLSKNENTFYAGTKGFSASVRAVAHARDALRGQTGNHRAELRAFRGGSALLEYADDGRRQSNEEKKYSHPI